MISGEVGVRLQAGLGLPRAPSFRGGPLVLRRRNVWTSNCGHHLLLLEFYVFGSTRLELGIYAVYLEK